MLKLAPRLDPQARVRRNDADVLLRGLGAKERAFAKAAPAGTKKGRCRPASAVMTFLIAVHQYIVPSRVLPNAA